jgi:hypothetical protein
MWIRKLAFILCFLTVAAVGGGLGGLATEATLYGSRHILDSAIVGAFLGFVFGNWAGLALLVLRPQTRVTFVALANLAAGFVLGTAFFLVIKSIENLKQ